MPSARPRAPRTVSAQPGALFRLRLGQTGVLETLKLKVRFADVVEDSRCPSEARCIRAGEVKVALWLEKDNRHLGKFVWTLEPDDTAATKDFQDFSVQVLRVEPVPEPLKPAAPKAYYRVILVVERR